MLVMLTMSTNEESFFGSNEDALEAREGAERGISLLSKGDGKVGPQPLS